MSKTKFNVLHTHSITINNKQFKVKRKTKEEEGISCCTLCDCCTSRRIIPTNPSGQDKNCINKQEDQEGINPDCYATIGWDGYLKRIKHVKNKI